MITANELREKFLQFFKEKGHAVIPSASLIPENDPTVLFTTAGMHPLVPYLMGAKHPEGTRLTDVQKCIRTGDIEEVGDNSHLTFFEMLGNWSLNDYFKKEAISWSWEFLTSPQWLGLNPENLAFSVFAGDDGVPADEESAQLWQQMGVPKDRIFYLPRKNNWWGPAGMTGPCGPDTEMFIVKDQEPCGPDCSPACDCGRYLEIWNDVFMAYNKTAEGNYEPLGRVNVDTGMGLERTIGVLQGVKSVYETDLFQPILGKIQELSGKQYGSDDATTRAMRIVADHIRTSTFILGDHRGVTPSNTDQGYILRRLIRRAVRFGLQLGMAEGFTAAVSNVIVEEYKAVYPELGDKQAFIAEQLMLEEQRFQRTLEQGIREFDKIKTGITQGIEDLTAYVNGMDLDRMGRLSRLAKQLVREDAPAAPELLGLTTILKDVSSTYGQVRRLRGDVDKLTQSLKTIDGPTAFRLYDTYGFPVEMTEELAHENGLSVDMDGFKSAFENHQKLSQQGAEQRFKGGLADHQEQTARLHTATHLLHAALRRVLGDTVEQRGSNITAERLRFDFSFGRKMTREEIDEVQRLVNEAISQDLPITMREATVDEARAEGAIGLFESRYGEHVKVYTMGKDKDDFFSKEICGGPHASHTGELGGFKIQKEEASSAGVRRIKAVIQV